MSMYVGNGEWHVIDFVVEETMVNLQRISEPISYMNFTLTLQRIPTYYIFNLIIPNVILSCLMLMCFCLPPDSGEKMTLCISNLLALVVFQQLVMKLMPPNGDSIPHLAYYFAMMIFLNACSCCLSVWVLSIYHHTSYPRPVPNWARRVVFDFMRPCLCMGVEKANRACRTMVPDPIAVTENPNFCMNDESQNSLEEETTIDVTPNKFVKVDEQELKQYPAYRQRNPTFRTAKNLETLLNHVTDLANRLNECDNREAMLLEWKELARIVDRFLLFVVTTAFLTILITLICML
ncbi:neuronal acetylcholine receptor subunit alpha-7-like [Saccoglossus kowalevskii]